MQNTSSICLVKLFKSPGEIDWNEQKFDWESYAILADESEMDDYIAVKILKFKADIPSRSDVVLQGGIVHENPNAL